MAPACWALNMMGSGGGGGVFCNWNAIHFDFHAMTRKNAFLSIIAHDKHWIFKQILLCIVFLVTLFEKNTAIKNLKYCFVNTNEVVNYCKKHVEWIKIFYTYSIHIGAINSFGRSYVSIYWQRFFFSYLSTSLIRWSHLNSLLKSPINKHFDSRIPIYVLNSAAILFNGQ